jgi:hypothetical protein
MFYELFFSKLHNASEKLDVYLPAPDAGYAEAVAIFRSVNIGKM